MRDAEGQSCQVDTSAGHLVDFFQAKELILRPAEVGRWLFVSRDERYHQWVLRLLRDPPEPLEDPSQILGDVICCLWDLVKRKLVKIQHFAGEETQILDFGLRAELRFAVNINNRLFDNLAQATQGSVFDVMVHRVRVSSQLRLEYVDDCVLEAPTRRVVRVEPVLAVAVALQHLRKAAADLLL